MERDLDHNIKITLLALLLFGMVIGFMAGIAITVLV